MKVTHHTHQTSGRISVNRHGSCPLLGRCHGYLACCSGEQEAPVHWLGSAAGSANHRRGEGKETGHVHAEVIIRFWREEDKMKRRRHGAAEEEEERPSLTFSFHGRKVKGQDGERGRRSQRDRSCC